MTLSDARATYGVQFTSDDPKNLRSTYAHSETALFEMLEANPRVVNDAVVNELMDRYGVNTVEELQRKLGGKIRVEGVTLRFATTRSVCPNCERGVALVEGKPLLPNATEDLQLFRERHPSFAVTANDALDDRLFLKGERLAIDTPSTYLYSLDDSVRAAEEAALSAAKQVPPSPVDGDDPIARVGGDSSPDTRRLTTPADRLNASPEQLAPSSRPLCISKR